MSGIYVIRGPLRRRVGCQVLPVFRRRYAFKGRPEHIGKPAETITKETYLPKTPAVTRFAPSPTGYLHLGSLRTALYNYLLANATGGRFLLRLEDTDQSRLVPDAESRLYEDLRWTGLEWDEGPDIEGPVGPYRQSDRLATYDQYAAQLLGSGQAYRCFCTPEELDALKLYNMEHSPEHAHQYNGKCSHIPIPESERRAANGEPHCVRLKSTGNPAVDDLVYGRYQRPEKEDDFILMKRDGYPTYHFANVVDDHEMEITHVIRGAEWLTSTPRHKMLYEAFEWQPPIFAHVGLLCNSQGQKLSKRSGDIDITSYQKKGILPIALLNYAVLLGWSPGRGEKGTSEVMNLDEMISKFHLRFTKGNIKLSTKLPFIQSKHNSRILSSLTSHTFRTNYLPAMEDTISALRTGPDGSHRPLVHALKFQPPYPSKGTDDSDGHPSLNGREDYLYRVFELDKKAYNGSMTDFVARNEYLFFTDIPTALHLQTFTEQFNDSFHIENRSTPSSTGHLQATDALTAILDDLSRFSKTGNWTQEELEPVVSSVCKQIQTSKEDGTAHVEGFRLLRWALFNARAGPALVPSLVVLGIQEVMERLVAAIKLLGTSSTTTVNKNCSSVTRDMPY